MICVYEMVAELSDDFNAESLKKNHVTTAEVYLPVTDATPAIQSALQNVRQQYNLTYQKQLDNEVNCSQLLNSSTINNTTYVPPKFVTIDRSQLQHNVNKLLLYPTNVNSQSNMVGSDSTSYSTIDQMPGLLPLNEQTILHSTSQPPQLAWHTPTIIQSGIGLHLKDDKNVTLVKENNKILDESVNIQKLETNNNSKNNVPIIGIPPSISVNIVKHVQPGKVELPHQVTETGNKSSIKLLSHLNKSKDLSENKLLNDQLLLETNVRKRKIQTNILLEDARMQKCANYSNHNEPNNLDLSFSSSQTSLVSEINETPPSATPFSESQRNENENIFDDFGYSSFKSLNNQDSPSSNINTSLIGNFDDSEYNVEEITNGSSFNPDSDIANQSNSSLDLPLDNSNYLPFYYFQNSPSSEVMSPFDGSITQTKKDLYLSPSSGKSLKYYNDSTTSMQLEHKDMSSVKKFSFVSNSTLNTNASNEASLHIINKGKSKAINHESKITNAKNELSRNLIDSDATSSNITMHLSSSGDKTLESIHAIDGKSVLLPNLFNDSFLPHMDDKQYGLPSLEFNPNIFSNTNPMTLPSLDHPLDFENLMDLDNLPLDK